MHAWRSLVVAAALFASATVAGGGPPTKTSNMGGQTASAPAGLKGAWKIVEQYGKSDVHPSTPTGCAKIIER